MNLRAPALVVAALLTLAGCSEPQAPPSVVSPSPSASTGTPEESFDPSSVPTGNPSDADGGVVTFTDDYTYDDGTAVRVTKIQHGTVSAADVNSAEPARQGDAWVFLTLRVTNGTDHALKDVYGDSTLTFGPEGKAADSIFLDSIGPTDDLDGSILPGKSGNEQVIFVVPAKYQNDVVLEFGFHDDYESAIFQGPLT